MKKPKYNKNTVTIDYNFYFSLLMCADALLSISEQEEPGRGAYTTTDLTFTTPSTLQTLLEYDWFKEYKDKFKFEKDETQL